MDDNHEDLPGATGFNPSNEGKWNVDGNSHGTHVAGTVAAIGNNGKGVVGVMQSNFNLRIGKGLKDSGSGSYGDIAACVDDCVASGARVISMSLGGTNPNFTLENSCKTAYNNDVLVIAAAGNGGPGATGYPAAFEVVMSVASVDSDSGLSSFSSTNSQVEIAGPGR